MYDGIVLFGFIVFFVVFGVLLYLACTKTDNAKYVYGIIGLIGSALLLGIILTVSAGGGFPGLPGRTADGHPHHAGQPLHPQRLYHGQADGQRPRAGQRHRGADHPACGSDHHRLDLPSAQLRLVIRQKRKAYLMTDLKKKLKM